MYETVRYYLSETLRLIPVLEETLARMSSLLWYARTSSPEYLVVPEVSGIDISILKHQVEVLVQQLEEHDQIQDMLEEGRSWDERFNPLPVGESESDNEEFTYYS